MSSAVIFGSAAKAVDQGTADRVLDLLFAYGVNHIDTTPRYGDAELRIGPWMDRHRDAFFLATKTDQWSSEGAKAQIRRSLERLRTDRVDLLPLHALIHPDLAFPLSIWCPQRWAWTSAGTRRCERTGFPEAAGGAAY